MTIRIASCRTLPEPDPDAAPLAEALARAGMSAEVVAWDDPAADWDAAVPTILRTTWNYAHDLDGFLRWVDRAAAAAPLWNPPEVVRDNVHKRYLLALDARGVPVVPTLVVEREGGGRRATAGLAPDLALLDTARVVIKPEVGAASLGARVFAAGDPAARAHLAALLARGAALVQPYVAAVETTGERSIVVIDGAPSHAIRKTPRFAGDRERVDGPHPIADDERAVAIAALAPYGDLLYARVDLVRDADGQPRVMELELVEPSLFLGYDAGAADRLVRALAARLP